MKQLLSNHNSGFTLIELLVSIAITGFIIIAVAKFQGDVFSFKRYFDSSLTSAEKAQKLLRPMTAEIRSASPSNTGAYPISVATQYDFSFYSDIDNDGLKELVRYYLSGTDLMKDVTKPTGNPLVYQSSQKVTTTFMPGVRNQIEGTPIFTFYDSTYVGGSGGVVASGGNTGAIRLIGVYIRLDTNPNQPPGPVDIATQVAVRNLKQQL